MWKILEYYPEQQERDIINNFLSLPRVRRVALESIIDNDNTSNFLHKVCEIADRTLEEFISEVRIKQENEIESSED